MAKNERHEDLTPRKVMFVLNRLAGGGAETQTRRIALGLAARGWGVTVVSLMPDVIPVPDLDNARIERVNLCAKRGFRSALVFGRLVHVLRARQPDAVVTMMIPADPLTRIAAWMARVPVISSIRNSYVGGRFVNALLRTTDRFVSVLTANAIVTQAELGPLICKCPDDMVVVPNALAAATRSEIDEKINVRAEHSVPDDAFLWLAVGSQRPQKNYPLLLDVLAQLPSNVYLWIAGAPYQETELKAISRQLGLEERVALLGRRADVPELLAGCDGFVQASAYEGTPNAVLEAMLAARPVVATAVGGVPETIAHGKSGWLVPAGCVDSLSGQMREVMELPVEERQKVADRGRNHVIRNHATDMVVARWEDVLEQAIKRQRTCFFGKKNDADIC